MLSAAASRPAEAAAPPPDWALSAAASRPAEAAAPPPDWAQGRLPIHAKAAKGPIRTLKWLVMAALLAIYYGAPWLRWDRGPYAPDQAILIDLPGRKAYFFLFEIWPQEVWAVTVILVMMAVGLFLVTASFGRLWCGFACPQTVWTDLFMQVERWIEGDRVQRMRRAAASWSLGKIGRRLLKHAAWATIAMLTGGAWVLYFNDAPTLVGQLVRLEPSAAVAATIALLTATTFLLAGWARETVCMVMCPFARFQSAMLDRDSFTVTYRAWRGEPRGKHKAGDAWEGRGHCIDCRQCVEVCPAGIDIRNGLQLQCINCALCVDACNAIMTRLNLPTGLVGYDTERNLTAAARGEQAPWRLVRPRTVIYAALYGLFGLGLLYALLTRSELDVTVLPDRNPLFVRLSDGAIRNAFTVKLLNKTNAPHAATLALEGLAQGRLALVGAEQPIPLKPDAIATMRAFVTVPADEARPTAFRFVVEDAERGLRVSVDAHFEGPAR